MDFIHIRDEGLPRAEDPCSVQMTPHFQSSLVINPFKPEVTIVIFIHHKPRIAVAILDL